MRFLLLFFFVFLSACELLRVPTRREQLAVYRTYCLEYGYEPGTVDFARCMENQETQDLARSFEQKKLRMLEEEYDLQRKERKEGKEKDAYRARNPLFFNW